MVIRRAREHQQLTSLTRHLNADSMVGREAGKGDHGALGAQRAWEHWWLWS